ncbi:MAG: hypothetical protein DRJ35_07370 [Thermoprotei archaeon]|nr:MAG: hypothetical protein DRJ35_07370 [Thermoprotei archaeon]
MSKDTLDKRVNTSRNAFIPLVTALGVLLTGTPALAQSTNCGNAQPPAQSSCGSVKPVVDWSEPVFEQIEKITRSWECDYLQNLDELNLELGIMPISRVDDTMHYDGQFKDIRGSFAIMLSKTLGVIGNFRGLSSEGFWTDPEQNGKTVGRDEQALRFGGLGLRVPLYLNGEDSENCETGFSQVFVEGGGLYAKYGGQFQYSSCDVNYHEKGGLGMHLGLGAEAKIGPNSTIKGLVDYNQLWLDYKDGLDDEIREVGGVDIEFLVENWIDLFGSVNMETSKTKDERATKWEPKKTRFTYDAGAMLRLGNIGIGMYARGLETDSPTLMAMGKLFFGAGASAYAMANLEGYINVGLNLQFGNSWGDSK